MISQPEQDSFFIQIKSMVVLQLSTVTRNGNSPWRTRTLRRSKFPLARLALSQNSRHTNPATTGTRPRNQSSIAHRHPFPKSLRTLHTLEPTDLF